MTHTQIPEITPRELADALDRGDAIQILDVRAPHRLAAGAIDAAAPAQFVNLPNSRLFALTDPADSGLRTDRPVVAVCGHGNASKQATAWLLQHGFEARSLHGGMAAWTQLLIPHAVEAPAGFSHLIQFDRLGKGALAYLLVADGEALIVDPPRDPAAILDEIDRLDAELVGVADTHVHADYISGAAALAAEFDVPYYLHPDDAVYPYDGTPGHVAFQKIEEGQEIPVGKAAVRVWHTPGHTEGSVTYVAGNVALTGDFLFVDSIGRPDLAGRTAEWAESLWSSLERVRRAWPADMLVLPAHYTQPEERRPDGVVGARFGDLPKRNDVHRITERGAFITWVTSRERTAPEAYRTIKAINVGLKQVDATEAEVLEAGKSECAVA